MLHYNLSKNKNVLNILKKKGQKYWRKAKERLDLIH